jgi:hypothetical protein
MVRQHLHLKVKIKYMVVPMYKLDQQICWDAIINNIMPLFIRVVEIFIFGRKVCNPYLLKKLAKIGQYWI